MARVAIERADDDAQPVAEIGPRRAPGGPFDVAHDADAVAQAWLGPASQRRGQRIEVGAVFGALLDEFARVFVIDAGRAIVFPLLDQILEPFAGGTPGNGERDDDHQQSRRSGTRSHNRSPARTRRGTTFNHPNRHACHPFPAREYG